jgi:CHASE1-domain containing sensor protein
MVEQVQQRLEQPIPRPLALDIKPDFLRVFYLIDQQRVRSVVEVIHPVTLSPGRALGCDALRERDHLSRVLIRRQALNDQWPAVAANNHHVLELAETRVQ